MDIKRKDKRYLENTMICLINRCRVQSKLYDNISN